ncbi:hypothetical protein OB69_15700 [Roseivirga seohaensis subsp. aquiponti]|uniref:DUF4625 domain-containing protein n=1 Tax=Roseivirga seohaensis subsp. aquiponti TaxID=1566026 RepID=A0A0L8AI16_9BACT|nr:DUF4625 domain-containing protein [Roseivirga seohaensis]KOF01785.1 hypothetical protein OB69_15700 [Roseivirga seohaensis subsp. aquiponti]
MKKHLIAILGILFISACSDDDSPTIDTEYPEIILFQDSFPNQCSVLSIGQTHTFKLTFKDNRELGGYSLDIHHNFDHHSHSTEVASCNLENKKTPVNALLFIKTYSIPDGLQTYEATGEITIPSDVDSGDYHFLIRLTDKEGWQTLKGISIKVG